MERIGDRITEDCECLAVKGLQRTGGHLYFHFARHIQILVKNEFDLLLLPTITLDKAGAGMKLYAAAATDRQLRIHAAACGDTFGDLFVKKQTQILGCNQFPEGLIHESGIGAGNKVQIAQPNPLKIGRPVGLDKSGQRLIQFFCKIFPAGIVVAGKGDEMAGQINAPHTVGRCELIIVDGLLLLDLKIAGYAGQFGGG